MFTNPTLVEMGFSKNDKLLIVHADDIGITESSVEAFHDLVDFGIVKSGSTMTPSAWFPLVVQTQINHPNWDIGIHLTLNCEFDVFKWKPISHRGSNSGIVDRDGFLQQNPIEVMKNANPRAVAQEIRAQTRFALKLGLKPSHVDSHSLILMSPRFIDEYIDIWGKFKILPFLFERASQMQKFVDILGLHKSNNSARLKGLPIFDNLVSLRLDIMHDHVDRFQGFKELVNGLKPGTITHFAMHPLKDTHETRALRGNYMGRIADYQVLMKTETKQYLRNKGIQLIGYKDILNCICHTE